MAIEVTFPFTKKVGNQRLQLARHEPMFEIRCPQAFPGSPRLEIVVTAIVLPPRVRILRIGGLRQTLFNGDGRLRSIPSLGRIHQHVTKLHIHTKVRRSFLPGFISDHSILLEGSKDGIRTPDTKRVPEFSVEIPTCSTKRKETGRPRGSKRHK